MQYILKVLESHTVLYWILVQQLNAVGYVLLTRGNKSKMFSGKVYYEMMSSSISLNYGNTISRCCIILMQSFRIILHETLTQNRSDIEPCFHHSYVAYLTLDFSSAYQDGE